MSSNWYLYLIRCADQSLYTGITTQVERRFEEHQNNNKKAAKYLRGRRPLTLVAYVEVGSRSDALKAEIQVKKLPKNKKIEYFYRKKM